MQLAGRIARAAAIFCVDEIIIFGDGEKVKSPQSNNWQPAPTKADFEWTKRPDMLLEHLLVYLDCPPYLRRRLFPVHDHLRGVGLLPSLDMPHHLRRDEWCQYREGVTLPRVNTSKGTSIKKRKLNEMGEYEGRASKRGRIEENNFALEKRTFGKQSTWDTKYSDDDYVLIDISLVDCGFPFSIPIPFDIEPSTRVTLRFPNKEAPLGHDFTSPMWYNVGGVEPEFRAVAVDPTEPREVDGLYWGYNVRFASSLSAVFKESPYDCSYDVSIGTSERGQPLHELFYPAAPTTNSPSTNTNKDTNFTEDKNNNDEVKISNINNQILPPKYSHALVVFGGVAGLEAACAADDELMAKIDGDRMNVGSAFDFWVNAVPGQGSRTIRTEEALFVVLSQLEHWLKTAGKYMYQ